MSTHPFLFNGELQKFGLRWLEPVVERLSGLRRLQHTYDAGLRGRNTDEFLAGTLDVLGVRLATDADDLGRIPASGGAIMLANHPHGGIDGIALAAMARRVRPDVRFLANGLLGRIPELAPLFISVDPFGGSGAGQRNRVPLRQAIRWVEQGGLLIIFPAGEVSHWQLQRAAVTDSEWHSGVARIIMRTQAPVIPVFVPGRNSLGFQLAGQLHPRLRTLLLPREMLNKKGRSLELRVGAPIAHERLQGLDAAQLLSFLRLHCYGLGEEQANHAPGQVRLEQAPLAPAQDPVTLAAELARLPAQACLVDSGDFRVYCTDAARIPRVLQEIGRLREQAFRGTGEGTGQALDIDAYDRHYLHLFIWHQAHRQIVGAYRLGQTDLILKRHGIRGLYTRSLFRFGSGLLDRLGPSLELGRSFVHPAYQRSYQPLLLLWRGIGAWVAAHPRYRVLFGPVSISQQYSTASRQLMVDFLKANNYQSELAAHVRPRQPFRGVTAAGSRSLTVVTDAAQLTRLLEQLEGDGKGIPVLLRQYLKLGGQILGFNVDAAFANVLDGLIMVDLARADAAMLARYMGRDAYQAFMAHHEPINNTFQDSEQKRTLSECS